VPDDDDDDASCSTTDNDEEAAAAAAADGVQVMDAMPDEDEDAETIIYMEPEEECLVRKARQLLFNEDDPSSVFVANPRRPCRAPILGVRPVNCTRRRNFIFP
jgi:hypothetical protein